jgi:hypothetical protein
VIPEGVLQEFFSCHAQQLELTRIAPTFTLHSVSPSGNSGNGIHAIGFSVAARPCQRPFGLSSCGGIQYDTITMRQDEATITLSGTKVCLVTSMPFEFVAVLLTVVPRGAASMSKFQVILFLLYLAR